MQSIFQTQIAKKINAASSVRIINQTDIFFKHIVWISLEELIFFKFSNENN